MSLPSGLQPKDMQRMAAIPTSSRLFIVTRPFAFMLTLDNRNGSLFVKPNPQPRDENRRCNYRKASRPVRSQPATRTRLLRSSYGAQEAFFRKTAHAQPTPSI